MANPPEDADFERAKAWLQRRMEADPRGEAPLDDITQHQMGVFMRGSGDRRAVAEQNILDVLWPFFGLVPHPLSHRLVLDGLGERLGESTLDCLLFCALGNHLLARFAAMPVDWYEKAAAEPFLMERISVTGGDPYHPSIPEAERPTAVTDGRYRFVAETLGLTQLPDWPSIDAMVRDFCRRRDGAVDEDDPYEDESMAMTLHGLVVNRKPA